MYAIGSREGDPGEQEHLSQRFGSQRFGGFFQTYFRHGLTRNADQKFAAPQITSRFL